MRSEACQHTSKPAAAEVGTTEVTATDGVRLHAEVHGSPAAQATIVLCHGYTLDSTSWHAQCAALAQHYRVVVWDQRGHGRSEAGVTENLTIRQLASDAKAVIAQTVERGPVVLAGHSMGGMTIMALAEHDPELFGDPITAVALVATSAKPLHMKFAQPMRVVTTANWLVLRALSTFERTHLTPGVHGVQGMARLIARTSDRFGVPSSLLTRIATSLDTMPVRVVAALLPQLLRFDKRTALTALTRTRTVIIGAGDDVVIPIEHSHAIAAEIPSAGLVVIPGAGHTLIFDQPEQVTHQLERLLVEQLLGEQAAAELDQDGAPDPRDDHSAPREVIRTEPVHTRLIGAAVASDLPTFGTFRNHAVTAG